MLGRFFDSLGLRGSVWEVIGCLSLFKKDSSLLVLTTLMEGLWTESSTVLEFLRPCILLASL